MKLSTNEREFWNVLRYEYDRNKVLKTNDDILRAIRISQRLNKVIDPLGNYIIEITRRVANKPKYKQYFYRPDLEADAIMLMLRMIMKFDTASGRNATGYLYQCCESACIRYCYKENREASLKESLLDQIKHAQEIN